LCAVGREKGNNKKNKTRARTKGESFEVVAEK